MTKISWKIIHLKISLKTSRGQWVKTDWDEVKFETEGIDMD